MQLKITLSSNTFFFFVLMALISFCALNVFLMADYGKSHLRVNDFLAPLEGDGRIWVRIKCTKAAFEMGGSESKGPSAVFDGMHEHSEAK